MKKQPQSDDGRVSDDRFDQATEIDLQQSIRTETDCGIELMMNPQSGTLDLCVKAQEQDCLAFPALSGSVEVDGRLRSLADAQPVLAESAADETVFRFGDGLVWRRQIRREDDRLYITALLQNETGRDVMVGVWNLLEGSDTLESVVNLGEQPAAVCFFVWQAWNMRVERFAGQNADYASETVCHLYDPHAGLTALLAFVTLDRMKTVHRLRCDDNRISAYHAQCSFGKHTLKAGEALQSETLRITYHTDPCAALENWADEVHAAYKPSFEGVAGVCLSGGRRGGGTWPESLHSGVQIAEEVLKGFGITLLSGGTHYMLKNGLPGNWLTFESFGGDPYACPKRLKAAHARGYTFKFWFSPFWFFAEAEGILEENRENLLRDARGQPLMEPFDGGGWEFARGPYNRKPLTQYFLDGTHPKTKAYLRKVFTAYREMGVRAYMLDFLSIRPDAKPFDDSLLPLETGREILRCIRETAGADTHLQTAVASTPGFIGCVQAARVVRDYGEGRPLYPYPNWGNAEYCLHDRHFANAHSFVQNAAASWFTHRKIYINDLNVLRIDKPIPLELARLSVTLFGLSGDSPMMIGDNLQTIDPERLRLLKMCLPRTTGIPVPVDLFDHVLPDGCCHILKKTVVTDWETYTLAAVFHTSPDNHNPVRSAYSDRLDFARLGLDPDASYRVFDYWNETYLGTWQGGMDCLVPPDACRLYRIAPARPHPWLLATDLHVEQGRAEIESLSWDPVRRVLKGMVRRPEGESGNLFFLMPRQLRLADIGQMSTMKEVIDMQTVIRLPVRFQKEKEPFELAFELMETPNVSRQGWLPYTTEAEWLAYLAEHKDHGSTRVIE
jgi:hypothetical protein